MNKSTNTTSKKAREADSLLSEIYEEHNRLGFFTSKSEVALAKSEKPRLINAYSIADMKARLPKRIAIKHDKATECYKEALSHLKEIFKEIQKKVPLSKGILNNYDSALKGDKEGLSKFKEALKEATMRAKLPERTAHHCNSAIERYKEALSHLKKDLKELQEKVQRCRLRNIRGAITEKWKMLESEATASDDLIEAKKEYEKGISENKMPKNLEESYQKALNGDSDEYKKLENLYNMLAYYVNKKRSTDLREAWLLTQLESCIDITKPKKEDWTDRKKLDKLLSELKESRDGVTKYPIDI